MGHGGEGRVGRGRREEREGLHYEMVRDAHGVILPLGFYMSYLFTYFPIP